MPFLLFARFAFAGSDDSGHRDVPRRPVRSTVSSQTDDPDSAAIAALRSDDPNALAGLIRAYAGQLEDYAFTFVRTNDAARDVVQDVFVALWDRRQRLVLRGTVASYLYGAARNRALSMLRHERAVERLEMTLRESVERVAPVSYNAGSAALDEEEFWAQVDAALASLPPRCREIFLLHRDQGLAYAEIAAMFGIGVATVHVQMSRAVRRLQEYLSLR